MSATALVNNYSFLAGGREMGDLIRKKDWSKTAVGAIDTWPPSLRITLGILLNSKFPMFLWWGKALTCFYNDDYRPSLGDNGKHPHILGMPAREAWPEIWDVIGPLIHKVMAGGYAHWSEDQLIPIYRNGQLEDVYWTFSYSPVNDECGNINGVLVVCTETTEKVLARKTTEENESIFRNMSDHAPVVIWTMDAEANQTFINKQWTKITGQEFKDIIGEGWKNAVHPEDIEKVDAAFKKANAEKSSLSLEYRIKNIHGDYRWIIDTASPKFTGGKFVGHIGSMVDITENKKAEEESARITAIVQSSEDAIIGKTLSGIVTSWNGAAERVFGYTAAEMIGQPIINLLPPDRMNEEMQIIDRLKKGERVDHFETKRLKKDGTLIDVSLTISPIRDASGKILGASKIARDITEQKNAEQKLQESEVRLRLATEGTKLATWDLDLKTKAIIYSPRLAEIFGHHAAKIITHAEMQAQVHEEDRGTIIEKAFDEAMKSGTYNYEARIIKPNKTISWIRTEGKVIFDENNMPVRMIGTLIDITQGKLYEQNLTESEEKFRILADSMPQFVWSGDKDGNLNYFSNAVYDYSGLTPEQILDGGWMQIVHPDDRQENIRQWNHCIETGTTFIFEHRFRKADGEYRWQLSRALPQKDDKGNIQMWVGTSTDIDEIKRHEQQKDDFIKIASHELKTPITTVKGYVQLLLKTHGAGNDSFLSGSLLTINKQVSKLTKLITDLLDVTKIETGSLSLTKETFFIGEVVKEIAADIKAAHTSHIIIIHTNANPRVYADKDRISQVLNNLFTNAIKYSPNADKVVIEINALGNSVIVSVQDFGIGISPKDHHKIFERFYRATGKDEKTFPGFGIGLFIVNEIITLHGGKIWVESEKDKGSTFKFSLPVSS